MEQVGVGEQKITPEKIDEIVEQLPTRYIKRLAEICYGAASEENVRRIKHWRSGKMKDPVETVKIYSAAEKLVQKCAEEVQQIRQK